MNLNVRLSSVGWSVGMSSYPKRGVGSYTSMHVSEQLVFNQRYFTTYNSMFNYDNNIEQTKSWKINHLKLQTCRSCKGLCYLSLPLKLLVIFPVKFWSGCQNQGSVLYVCISSGTILFLVERLRIKRNTFSKGTYVLLEMLCFWKWKRKKGKITRQSLCYW